MQLTSKKQNLTFSLCLTALFNPLFPKSVSIHVEAMFHYLLKFFFIYLNV